MEPLRIALPLMSLRHHGGVRVLAYLASHLAERGHRVSILVPKNQYQPVYPLSRKVELVLLRSSGQGGLLSRLKTLWDLERALERLEPDVILANFFPTAYVAWPLRKRSRVVHLVQDSPRVFGGPITSRVVSLSFRFPYERVAISRFVAQDASPVAVITPGVAEGFWPDPDPELVASKYAPAVLHLPRRQPFKGLRTFIEAMTLLRDWGFVVELWLITKEAEVLSEFQEARLHYKLIEASDDDSMRRAYSSADVFVMSSEAESFSLPPLEAMASGVPAVITDAGGVQEYARDGENCLLVPPGRPEALARAIRRVLEDPGLARRLIQGGLATAQRLSLRAFVERVARLVEGTQEGFPS